MSTESIVNARSLRQFLAREAIEKETSIGQSPDQKTGSKIKTPHGAPKNMHKERRGNSQVNNHKNHKSLKETQNKRHSKGEISETSPKINNAPDGVKKTTWIAERNAAKIRKRRRKILKIKIKEPHLAQKCAKSVQKNLPAKKLSKVVKRKLKKPQQKTVKQEGEKKKKNLPAKKPSKVKKRKLKKLRQMATKQEEEKRKKNLPAKKLSKVEKRKLKKLRQEAAKQEEEKKKNTKNKNKKKKEEEESEDESESDMDTYEEAKEEEKKNPQGFQTLGPAVQGTGAGLVSNPPQPQGTLTTSNTRHGKSGRLDKLPRYDDNNQQKHDEHGADGRNPELEHDAAVPDSSCTTTTAQHDSRATTPQPTQLCSQLSARSSVSSSNASITVLPVPTQRNVVERAQQSPEPDSPDSGTGSKMWLLSGAGPGRSQLEAEDDDGRNDAATVSMKTMSDFTQKQLMKKVMNFNNNPNSSLFKVNFKPKSARGLFGASTSENLLSSENPHSLQMHELCNQQSYKDQGQVIMADIQRRGEGRKFMPW